MKKSKLNEAIGYLRTATTIEDNANNSLYHQKKAILKWAKENNTKITKFYSEVASSFSYKRPILELMIAEINEKVVTPGALIVKSTDRLSKSISTTIAIDSLLKDKSIELITTNNLLPNSLDTCHFIKSFIDMSNEVLSKANSQRIQSSLNNNAKKGYFTGGVLPFGYSTVPMIPPNSNVQRKTLVLNPIEAAIVKELFNLATKGINGKKLSLGGIARALNQQNLLRRGTQWDYRKVTVILKNPIYYGERLWGKNRTLSFINQQLITIRSPSIISKEQFLSAQKNYAFAN